MRCFVAVDISPEIKEKLSEIQKNFKNYGTRLTESNNFHFTMKFMGEIDKEKAKLAAKALNNIKMHPFRICLKGIGAFPNERFPHIIWAGCLSDDMKTLSTAVDNAMESLGFAREKDYESHVTIARIKHCQKDMQEKLEQLENIEIGEMDVTCIKLKRSILTKRGPIYEDLAKVMLGF